MDFFKDSFMQMQCKNNANVFMITFGQFNTSLYLKRNILLSPKFWKVANVYLFEFSSTEFFSLYFQITVSKSVLGYLFEIT